MYSRQLSSPRGHIIVAKAFSWNNSCQYTQQRKEQKKWWGRGGGILFFQKDAFGFIIPGAVIICCERRLANDPDF